MVFMTFFAFRLGAWMRHESTLTSFSSLRLRPQRVNSLRILASTTISASITWQSIHERLLRTPNLVLWKQVAADAQPHGEVGLVLSLRVRAVAVQIPEVLMLEKVHCFIGMLEAVLNHGRVVLMSAIWWYTPLGRVLRRAVIGQKHVLNVTFGDEKVGSDARTRHRLL